MKSKKVKVQLKWFPQAQFAGILVALEKGFFKEERIEVLLIPGSPGITIENRVTVKAADIGVSSLDSLMVHQEEGYQLLSIAQILQRSSMGLVTYKSSGIDVPEKMKRKTIGSFGGSNQFQLLAFLNKYNIANKVNLELQQSINDFLTRKIDVGIFTTYNELQTIFENGVERNDLNLFRFESEGVGMLEDTIIVRKKWLEKNRDLAVRFVYGMLKGWRFSFEHPQQTVDIVMKYVPEGSTTIEHQTRMLNVLKGLIMPNGFQPCDIGRFNRTTIQRSADILFKFGLVKQPVNIGKLVDPSIVEKALKDC